MTRAARSRAERQGPHGVEPDFVRQRRRGAWTAAVALVVAGLAGAVVIGALPRAEEGPPPTVQLVARDGVVVATGQGFFGQSAATVGAQLAGGSAAARVAVTDAGTFEVAFQPFAGFDGEIAVSATAGPHTAQASADAPRALPAAQGDAPAGLLVVPTTGSPARSAITLVPSGLPVVRVPGTIAADCSSDVTEPLNAWLASVPDGSEIVFGRSACYRVDGRLELIDRSELVIEGNGAMFRAEQKAPVETNRSQWYLEYGNEITLRNMRLSGVNTQAVFDADREWDHNLFIRGTRTATIENVHGRGAYGDFIAIAQGPDQHTIPSDITIRDVSADTIGRMGISCVACDGVSVEDSVFNNIAYHVFDLEVQGDGWPGRGISYTDNVIGSHGWAFFSVGTPFQTEGNDISDVRISGNVMTMPGSSEVDCLPAVSFRSSKIDADGVIVEGNVLLSHTTAIDVRRASGVVISDNTAELTEPTCGDPVGIRASDVDGLDVGGNDLAGYEQEQVVIP